LTLLVAREPGTHCRTAPLPEYERNLARLAVDSEGRALRLCQPDDEQPSRLKIYAGIPDEDQAQAPSIRVTAICARHVTRETTRRLYPLHTEAAELASQRAARQQAEADGRRAVTEAGAATLPAPAPYLAYVRMSCSPHARGWSYRHVEVRVPAVLLPARAGMVPSGRRSTGAPSAAPRACGADPSHVPPTGSVGSCSPACAGMVPPMTARLRWDELLPHERYTV
jgi:hypothetical protein